MSNNVNGLVCPKQIREIVYRLKKNYDCVIGECHSLSKDLLKELSKSGCPAQMMVGAVGKEPHLTSKHFWIYIKGEYVEGVDAEFVFVDPTIDQFRTENAQKGRVDIDLGTNLPEVGIFTPCDDEYNWYRHHGLPDDSLAENATKNYLEKGWSIEKLAEEYDTTTPTIKRWINNHMIKNL